jgi:hypothetical protein
LARRTSEFVTDDFGRMGILQLLKGFYMLPHEEDRIQLGRRDVVLAVLLLPFLVNASVTDLGIVGEGSLSTETKDDFVILGGWVFLKSDLIGNLG